MDIVCDQLYSAGAMNVVSGKLFDGLGVFKMGGQVICTVK